ncbi:MAG: M48 family metallopeptidase [Phycisphaerales bacterium JB037]
MSDAKQPSPSNPNGPKRPTGQPAGRPAPRPKPSERPLADELKEKISAYPGTTTFLDLMRKNRRDSVLLIVAMFILTVALGSAVGSLIGAYAGGSRQSIYPTLAIGAIVGLALATGGTLFSWFGGAKTMLRMTHAREIQKHDDPELFNVVDEMRIAAGIPMPRVYIVNDSAMNAFATGRDPKHGIVAITTGLRQKLNRDELQAVIAHEIAHIRHLDIRFAMLMATMVGLIVVISDGLLRTMWYSGGARRGRSSDSKGGGAAVVIILIIAVLLAILAPILARIIQMSYSRQREYLADAGAVELTRNPKAMASALSRLAGDEDPFVDTANRGMAHMFIVNPLKKMRESHQQFSSVFASHPPIKDRIARMLALLR